MGPMFRYERPQAGRYRQFHQLGVEHFGASHPWPLPSDREALRRAADYQEERSEEGRGAARRHDGGGLPTH